MNNELPHYFDNFNPVFSVGHERYNLRNTCRQLPIIRHEFPKQSLRYKLIITLNDTPQEVINMATVYSLKKYSLTIKYNMIDKYLHTCTMLNCYICSKDE